MLKAETNDPLVAADPNTVLVGPARAAVSKCTAVIKARRLTGGANQETWAFDAVTPQGDVPLILRRARGGTLQRETGIGLEMEAHVIAVAHAHGVMVPEVLYRLKPEDGIGDGFIMRRLVGETVPRKILKGEEFDQVRPLLAAQCGKALATLHAVPTSGLEGLMSFTPLERVEWLYGHFLATEQVIPVFSYAFAWLRENAPSPPGKQTLVHGDFR
ncbi:MAG: phosphotransferase family protein, partial [Anaerolineales bacterium]